MSPRSTITELSSAPIVRTAGNTIAGHKIARRPSSNFRLQNDSYLLSLAVPGYRPENFEVKIHGNIIQINASKNNGMKCSFGRCEYEFASWERSFILPNDADPILATARYQNGELSIILSRKNNTDLEEGEYTIYVY